MLIAGAGGHAREILFEWQQISPEPVFFYDDTGNAADQLFDQFGILHDHSEAAALFLQDPRFIIGVGNPSLRSAICEKLEAAGGKVTSLVSKNAVIGQREVMLGEGLNIMSGAVLTTGIHIGKGTLIHIHTSVHHDCRIGEFCEISPGCRILGKVVMGDRVSVGSAAVILPGIQIGSDAVIGAGAVVTRNVPAGARVKGVPAKQ